MWNKYILNFDLDHINMKHGWNTSDRNLSEEFIGGGGGRGRRDTHINDIKMNMLLF
jgi:hypothetical protein